MDLALRPHGMFSNVNQVINACRLVELGEIDPFYVNGDHFLYRPEGFAGNPWDLYLEQPFPDAPSTGKFLDEGLINSFITPYTSDLVLLPPTDRFEAQQIIETYIRPRPCVTDMAAAFIERHNPESKAACLLRGPGKMIDLEGAAQRTHDAMYGAETDYREPFARVLDKLGLPTILYSDASNVLEWMTDRCRDHVEWTDTPRLPDGEMHHHATEGQEELGRSILAQVLMMTQALVFIHGSSNIANYVLGANPHVWAINVHEYAPTPC
jgi:hypothetical protein